ncbi:phosphatase phospho-type [Cladochytrium replicatum]|nr:phosphatase phospho-type [Cladochytrium replicatum]
MTASSQKCTLVCYDFDWTIVDEDTDNWMFLLRPNIEKELREESKKGRTWVNVVIDCLQKLQSEPEGVTLEQIAERLQTIPFSTGMQFGIRRAKDHGAQQCILSDANQFSIATVLKHYGLYEHFSKIITNRADVSEGKLKVAPWNTEPHACENGCTYNLCKGSEILKIIDRSRHSRVVYLGDGRNDFCPATKLQKGDIVLVRTGRALERIMKSGDAEAAKVVADVRYWSSGEDVLKIYEDLFP